MSDDLISRKALAEEVKSLTVTVTGLRAGKGMLNDYAKQYRDSILRLIDEAPVAYDVDGWILFSKNYDEDYGAEILQGPLPDDGQEILVTDGKNVWLDTFMIDGQECYLGSGSAIVDEVIAWRPLPEPYKEGK